MDQVTEPTIRDGSGRFVPGQSGNPRGKKPGTPNRATVLRALLRDGDEDAIGRGLIDRARDGDPVAARFLFDALHPKPRQRAITLDVADAGDAAGMFQATGKAMVTGQISPDEARTAMRFVAEGLKIVHEATELAHTQAVLRRFRGEDDADADDYYDDDDDDDDDDDEPAEAPEDEEAAVDEAPAAPVAPAEPVPTRRRAVARARAHRAKGLHSACKSTITDKAPSRRRAVPGDRPARHDATSRALHSACKSTIVDRTPPR